MPGLGACCIRKRRKKPSKATRASVWKEMAKPRMAIEPKLVELKGEQRMSGKKVGVFGIYASRLAVEKATDSLVTAGFPVSDISVLMPETLGGAKHMGTKKATKAPEGTAAGVTAGGVIGGTLGVLAGIGVLAICNCLASGHVSQECGGVRTRSG